MTVSDLVVRHEMPSPLGSAHFRNPGVDRLGRHHHCGLPDSSRQILKPAIRVIEAKHLLLIVVQPLRQRDQAMQHKIRQNVEINSSFSTRE